MFSKFDTNPQSEEFLPADLYEAQAEWENEQAMEDPDYEHDPYDVLNDLWEDYHDDPADMYEWDCDLYNEF
jgi:F0F1-type ATP synthase gamma subunit